MRTFLTSIAAFGLMSAAACSAAESPDNVAEASPVATPAPAPEKSEIVRHKIPGSDFPILVAVEVPADATLVYLSGTVPKALETTDTEEGASPVFGDTKAQTETTFASIAAKLDSIGLSMSDVIKVQVYLVRPEGASSMDFAGFMEGYVQFFGTQEQPNLPTRSVFEVAGLANPAWLVEIEVVAVR